MIVKLIIACFIFAFGWFCACMFSAGKKQEQIMDEHGAKNN